MGGKSYFCDYCNCFMKNDVTVRKQHNSGLSHTVAKATYMRRYEDPSKILIEERNKVPCKRYLNGYCKFELFCQFGHYTEKQLRQLQKIATKLKNVHKKQSKNRGKPIPGRSKQSNKLPLSLRPINFAKISQINFNEAWG